MASVDIDDADSESSDLQKARKLYAELQAMSMESTGSTEVTVKWTISVAKIHQKCAKYNLIYFEFVSKTVLRVRECSENIFSSYVWVYIEKFYDGMTNFKTLLFLQSVSLL